MVWDHEVRGSSPRTPTSHARARESLCGSNSVGRVPAFQAGCRGFESRLPLFSVNRLSEAAFQAHRKIWTGGRNGADGFCAGQNTCSDSLPRIKVDILLRLL